MNTTTQTRKQDSTILNYITAARGERVSTLEEEHAIIGYKNLFFWHPSKQAWIAASSDPDKFILAVPCPDGDSQPAWKEFWSRWSIYINKRFPGLTYIKIESTN